LQFFGVFLHRFPEGRRLLLAQAVALGGVELADSIFQAIESADLADGPKRFADRFLQRLVEAPASVRRLVRDGVDSPLANLFVQVAADPLQPPLNPLLSKEGSPRTPLLCKEGQGVVGPPLRGSGPAFRPAAQSLLAAGRSVRAGRPQGGGQAGSP